MSRDGAAGAECLVDVCLRPLMASVLLSPFHTAAHHFVAVLPACQGGKGTSLLRTTILLQPVLQSELYLLSLPPFWLVWSVGDRVLGVMQAKQYSATPLTNTAVPSNSI